MENQLKVIQLKCRHTNTDLLKQVKNLDINVIQLYLMFISIYIQILIVFIYIQKEYFIKFDA